MRKIRWSKQFTKDHRRESRGTYRAALDALLREVVALLLSDTKLPDRLRDHALNGKWETYRDCHLRPNLVLIYRKTDDELLFARLGSHSELGL